MQRKRRCFGCSTREEAPAFSNAEIWRAFPIEDFDVVVIDSWDSFAEGAGEQDSGRSTRALAPLLDLVRRECAPGVVLLGNVTKDGRAGRGSGTVEDRVDNVFEVRDATGFSPSGEQKWWEEVPAAGRGEWAVRATRRAGKERPERIRLAFISSKCRDDDDPRPFVLELDFTTEPWSVQDVTDDLADAGDAARAAELAQEGQRREAAATALVAELRRRAEGSPLLKTAAEHFLSEHRLKRPAARERLASGGSGRWQSEPVDGKSVAIRLAAPVRDFNPRAESETNESSPVPASPATIRDGGILPPAAGEYEPSSLHGADDVEDM